MKSKASCFSFSKVLLLENFRRYWTIPAMALLIYLLGGVFPLMLNYDGNFDRSAQYIENMLNGQNGLFIVMGFGLPLVTALVCFDYMQKSSSATSVHSMPFSRNKLFNTSVISGYLMAIIPFLITALILLIIARPTYYTYAYDELNILSQDAENVFLRAEILYWIVETLVTTLFVYAIAVFAGMISGNSVIHAIMSMCWNWLAPALGAVTIYFASQFLYGYCESWDWVLKTSPTIMAGYREQLTATCLIVYVLVALAILAISALLYSRRKLERTGDAIVFTWMKPILCCLLALFTMVLMGVYFETLGDGEISLYIGYLVGALLGYLIASMIVYKTPKVFNLKTLKGFGIYCLVAVVFIAGCALDFTGYGKKIPAVSSVQSVYLSGFSACTDDDWDRYNPDNFIGAEDKTDVSYESWGRYNAFNFTEPENIANAVKVHEYIVSHKEISSGFADEAYRSNGYVDYSTVRINYDLTVGSLSREYTLATKALSEIPELAALYESEEYKSFYSFKNMKMDSLSSIEIRNNIFGEFTTFEGKEAEELLAALDKDFMARTYEQATDYRNATAAEAYINYNVINVDDEGYTWEGTPFISVSLFESDTNTLAWLKNHGAANPLRVSADNIDCLDVFYNYDRTVTLKDRKDIEYVVENGLLSNNRLAYGSYLEFQIYTNGAGITYRTLGEIERDYQDGKISWEQYDKECNVASEYCGGSLYLPMDMVPERILEQVSNSHTFKDMGYVPEDLGLEAPVR